MVNAEKCTPYVRSTPPSAAPPAPGSARRRPMRLGLACAGCCRTCWQPSRTAAAAAAPSHSCCRCSCSSWRHWQAMRQQGHRRSAQPGWRCCRGRRCVGGPAQRCADPEAAAVKRVLILFSPAVYPYMCFFHNELQWRTRTSGLHHRHSPTLPLPCHSMPCHAGVRPHCPPCGLCRRRLPELPPGALP